MTVEATSALLPPLELAWKNNSTELSVAVAGGTGLYGITSSGSLIALNGSNGAVRWRSSAQYVGKRLVRQGSRLFAYRLNEGFGFLDDRGDHVEERLVLSFGASPQVNLSAPVIDERMIYFTVNQGFYAVHQESGLQFGEVLDSNMPHSVGLVPGGHIVVIDGRGVPTRYRITNSSIETVWTATPQVPDVGLAERPFVIAGDWLVVGIGATTVAYDLGNGNVAWRLDGVPARSLLVNGNVIYIGFIGVSLWAVEASSGTVLWQRQFMYDQSLQLQFNLTLANGYLYYGGWLQTNPDQAILLGIRADNGQLAWCSRSAAGEWASGIPVQGDSALYVCGRGHVGSYRSPSQTPRVLRTDFAVSPSLFRGPSSGFGSAELTVNLTVSARITAQVYRESLGIGKTVVGGLDWGPGQNQASWAAGGSGGFSDRNQFGLLLVTVEESRGPTYTHSLLLPVNALPDILWHWARLPVETMIYHKLVSGYPDHTFKPDNPVTRAESSVIIAKTLGLEAPSPNFQTKFMDMGGHWARPHVLALEEAGVIGGFLEPDGTYTFRPDLNMSRAQEARILVNAYAVPAAPPGFLTRFKDVDGHWARGDILALEAAGHVNGYREADGTFTYRPERSVSRAELSAVVVRIRGFVR